MSHRLITVPTVLAVLAVSTAACSSGSERSSADDPFVNAGVGLCRAADVADRPDEARAAFFDSVHQPLHELADETATRDRAVAADLLEAKQRVEAAFDGDESSLPGTIEELVDATDAALRTLDRPQLDCRNEQ